MIPMVEGLAVVIGGSLFEYAECCGFSRRPGDEVILFKSMRPSPRTQTLSLPCGQLD